MLTGRTTLDDDNNANVEEHGVPLYLYDGDTIKKKVLTVRNALPDFKILYSIKANPSLPYVLFQKIRPRGRSSIIRRISSGAEGQVSS